ncbi:hypothetical protein Bca101_043125 [Brassica carinata]
MQSMGSILGGAYSKVERQQQLSSREGSVENTMVFPSKELEKATEGFSLEMVVGRGEVVKGLCLRECKLTEKNRRS